jgi:hypothetical protein
MPRGLGSKLMLIAGLLLGPAAGPEQHEGVVGALVTHCRAWSITCVTSWVSACSQPGGKPMHDPLGTRAGVV